MGLKEKIRNIVMAGACAGALYGYVSGVYHQRKYLALCPKVEKVNALEYKVAEVQSELDRKEHITLREIGDLIPIYHILTQRLEELEKEYNLIANPEMGKMKQMFDHHSYHGSVSALIMMVSSVLALCIGLSYLKKSQQTSHKLNNGLPAEHGLSIFTTPK